MQMALCNLIRKQELKHVQGAIALTPSGPSGQGQIDLIHSIAK